MRVSVIIITLNEADNIKEVIQSVKSATQFSSGIYSDIEIILSDGGSIDKTVDIAKELVDKILISPKGKYKQLNYGAKDANGEILLFLHGDTRLPPHAILIIKHLLKNSKILGGGFKKSWDWNSNIKIPAYIRFLRKFGEGFGNWLVVLLNTFPGDNAIFIRKDIFRALNGFSPILVCEGLDLIRRLKQLASKTNGQIICIHAAVKTSARRLEKFGVFKTVSKWFLFYWLWKLGISYSKLNEKYNKQKELSESL
jgi:glycosyltransferase involved in cell wall biosynthesis